MFILALRYFKYSPLDVVISGSKENLIASELDFHVLSIQLGGKEKLQISDLFYLKYKTQRVPKNL